MKLAWKLAFPQICIVLYLGLISFIVINDSFVTMRERYVEEGKIDFALYANKNLLRFSAALRDAEKHPPVGDFVRVTKENNPAVEALITADLLMRGQIDNVFESYGSTAVAARPLLDYSGVQAGVMVCVMSTEAISSFAFTSGITLAIMLAGIVIAPSVALLLRTRKLVSHPLNLIKSKIQDIAEDRANLSEQVPSRQRDEIGELAGWFNVLTAKLAGILAEMSEIIRKNIEIKVLLAKEKEFFQTTVNSIGDAVITMGVDGAVITMNDAAEDLTGFSKKYAIGKHFSYVFSLIHEKSRNRFDLPMKKNLEEGIAVSSESYLLVAYDGQEKHIAFNCSPIRGEGAVAMGAVLICRDISESKLQSKKMEYLSYHDKLTGLYNRAFFEHACEALQQQQIVPVSVIVGDANGLKYANDVYGHAAGDHLLQTIASAFKSACRNDDIIARWGGDEFVALLPGLTQQRANSIMTNIHLFCEETHSDSVQVSVSLGVATKDSTDIAIAAVFKAAEEKMYEAKHANKNVVR